MKLNKWELRMYSRKKYCAKKEEIDESGNNEVNRLVKECLRVDYFFFIIDQARC